MDGLQNIVKAELNLKTPCWKLTLTKDVSAVTKMVLPSLETFTAIVQYHDCFSTDADFNPWNFSMTYLKFTILKCTCYLFLLFRWFTCGFQFLTIHYQQCTINGLPSIEGQRWVVQKLNFKFIDSHFPRNSLKTKWLNCRLLWALAGHTAHITQLFGCG